ncbi:MULTISPECIES: EF-P 5-aminopentanol modification-associated protein YfmF [unclassified Ruminococcus]|uniref:EF-P 5-aminopentanol modification-associated protein YfmF n=1 Tax=unclassified Ruminococcus TaxID=2608920 RepID=UPI00210CBEDE|nr:MULTISPECIES: pitrilysin family protein [unclassified Ruminococcus]MCQ4021493.1 insulinase family protein [Ruminococcus sp. zg-924]MCQ4113938.1 insulinase family protein [Ruminococcus sp. zg-921]
MEQLIRRELSHGIYLNSVRDDRFKSGRISVNMFVPLKEETAAENALLTQLLGRSCKDYPDYISLNREVSRLYGAALTAECVKMGDFQAITLSVSGLDDRYTLNGEVLSKELAELLCKMIFEPKLEGEAFAGYDVEQERRQLLELIEAEANEKRGYAIKQCIRLMCENDRFGISRFGTYEQVQCVTPEQLYKAWRRVLETAIVNIVVVGELDSEGIGEALNAEFKRIERKPVNGVIKPYIFDGEVKQETEIQEVMQSKLVLGFSCNITAGDERADHAKLMTLVLGGTPSSKLFTNVREKESLCYYCAASYNRQKGIILVDSGVEKQNIEKAKKEILNQLEQIKLGNITEFEISAAKLAVGDSAGMVTDSVSGIDKFYSSQLFEKEILSPAQAAQRISAVTKEQIVEAAKCVELAAVYVLTDGKEGIE